MKSLIPWVCVVALLAGAYFLYSAGQAKEVELAVLRAQVEELKVARAENEELKKQVIPAAELTKLRKDNEDLPRLRAEIRQLRETSRELTNMVDKAARVQVGQAQALAAENAALRTQTQQLQDATAQAAQQQANAALAPACIATLRALEVAKHMWAADNARIAGSVPTVADLQPYLRAVLPACPSGGTYSINALGVFASCSVPGHVFNGK